MQTRSDKKIAPICVVPTGTGSNKCFSDTLTFPGNSLAADLAIENATVAMKMLIKGEVCSSRRMLNRVIDNFCKYNWMDVVQWRLDDDQGIIYSINTGSSLVLFCFV